MKNPAAVPGFFLFRDLDRRCLAVDQRRKTVHQCLIDITFEGHGQIDQRARRDPPPFAEFRLFGVDIDVGVITGKAQRHPFLLLATILAMPQPVGQRQWNVIVKPLVMLLQKRGFLRADFLAHR